MLRLEDIPLRDPFVLPVKETETYYLYGTTDEDCWGPRGTGFDVYQSHDLNSWEGPFPAFRPPVGFWGTHHFWAPEVYARGGHYVMFASFKSAHRCRGVQVLQAKRPEGPFLPLQENPLTPPDWECLDGTLFEETSGHPWMVFCREWKQVTDGTIEAMPLAPDLRRSAGEPVTLFSGSSVSWSCGPEKNPAVRVTDGPWLHRSKRDDLWMLWSTLGPQGYALCASRSENGSVTGNWIHSDKPIFARDGGHAMVFHRFDGQAILTLHRPNRRPLERPVFFRLREDAGGVLEIISYEPAA